MSNLFLGNKQASVYAKFRPTTSQVVVDKIIAYLSENIKGPHETALDVGCGSGQSTRILSSYFQEVIGFDVSDSQLLEAEKMIENPSNVTFQKSLAEVLPFGDESIHLITCSASFHWFQQEEFLLEAQRILTDNGVLDKPKRIGSKSPKLLPDFSNTTSTILVTRGAC